MFSPWDVAANPNGSTVYESADDPDIDNPVRVLSTATNKITATIRARAETGLAFNPDGKLAYACNGDGSGLNVINTRTNRVMRTIPLPSQPFGYLPMAVAVGPDGRDAYVVNQAYIGSGVGNVTVTHLGGF